MGSSRKAMDDKPWLALPPYPNPGKSRRFVSFQSISTNKVYHRRLPADASGTICGSSAGFFIVVDETTSQITMVDLLSKARFQPPPISSSLAPEYSTDITHSGREKQKYFVHKAVLSSPPDCNPYDYILMIIYGEKKELAYYKARSESWIKLEEAGHSYDDIIFHDEGFYAVNEYGKVVFCQPGSTPNVEEIAPPWLFRGSKLYLVATEDYICVVIRFLKENPDVGYETYKFEVHLMESDEEWKHIAGLEDRAIFLGRNQSVALQSSLFDGLKGNCIYFTDDNLEPYKYGGVTGGHDIGVFDIEEESFLPLQCCEVGKRFVDCPRPVWLTPLQY